MKTPFTISTIKNSPVGKLNPHLFDEKEVKKSKYKNEIVEFDNKSFRSKKELARYVVLRMKQKLGEITDLQLQVPFELNDGGTHSLAYIADFVYYEKGKIVVEDCKGYKTKLFLKKQRLMKEILNIEIKLS